MGKGGEPVRSADRKFILFVWGSGVEVEKKETYLYEALSSSMRVLEKRQFFMALGLYAKRHFARRTFAEDFLQRIILANVCFIFGKEL